MERPGTPHGEVVEPSRDREGRDEEERHAIQMCEEKTKERSAIAQLESAPTLAAAFAARANSEPGGAG